MLKDQKEALRAADQLACSAAALLDHFGRNLNRMAEELSRALEHYQTARGDSADEAA
jgi:hypothetical protein